MAEESMKDVVLDLSEEVAIWKRRAKEAQQAKRGYRQEVANLLVQLEDRDKKDQTKLDDYDGIWYDYGPLKGQTLRKLVSNYREQQRKRISELEAVIRKLVGNKTVRDNLRACLDALEKASEEAELGKPIWVRE